MAMPTSLDDADRSLLDLLQRDARAPLEALAEESGLSVATVQRRVKRLRKEGVIVSEVAVLDPNAVGLGMTFVVMVELERERLEQLDAFRASAIGEPLVQQCYYVTGDADFCLICVARDMAEFEALTHRLFFENANVRRFRTSVVMGRDKVGLAVPCARVQL